MKFAASVNVDKKLESVPIARICGHDSRNLPQGDCLVV